MSQIINIDKKLIDKVSEVLRAEYSENTIETNGKLMLTAEDVEHLLKDLMTEIDGVTEYYEDRIARIKNQYENDFIPEREVPEIHGKGISW